MDIQMYLSLKRSIKEKLPIEVYFGGTVATKALGLGCSTFERLPIC
jgi:hypothetical protein